MSSLSTLLFAAVANLVVPTLHEAPPAPSRPGGFARPRVPQQPAPPRPAPPPRTSKRQLRPVRAFAPSIDLHVVAIYEARRDHSFGHHPSGDAEVIVTSKSPQVLVLSSYEPVQWKITVAPGAKLEHVIAYGYHQQAVDAPPNVPVDILGSPSDDEHLRVAEQLTTLQPTSSIECYTGTRFELTTHKTIKGTCQP